MQAFDAGKPFGEFQPMQQQQILEAQYERGDAYVGRNDDGTYYVD